MRSPTLLLLLLALASRSVLGAVPVEVVTSLPVYAAIAREVGGDRLHVQSIARGDEDAHFVDPKPSYAFMLRDADLFVTTGLDLELWVPALIDKSGNRSIRPGAPGYVAASDGVPLLEVPDAADRSAGDVHLYGNPHFFTSPLNAKIIATNVAAGLERVDPEGAPLYREGLAAFHRRIDEALYGPRLTALMGPETLDPLARQGKLISFVEGQRYQDRPLIDLLGGWLGRAEPLRSVEIVAYHKNWVYFTDLFGIRVADFVEPKPGIPPSARHVHDLVRLIEDRGIGVILAASYFGRQKIDTIAERTGCRAVVVPLGPGVEGIESYFELVDRWVDELLSAVRSRRHP